MKKVISMMLSTAMLCSSLVLPQMSAKADTVVFKHQNVVGSQTCYTDDTAEKTITEIPDVIQGMRINQPVFRAEGLTASKSYTVKQELKDGTAVRTDTVTADASGKIEFKHARNCEMIEILDGSTVVASLGADKAYTNGVMITYAPMSWQVFQRDENDKATITIKGETEADDTPVTVEIDGTAENVTVNNRAFTYTKELSVGQYDITVKSGANTVATYENVAVGDVWVAAGQSNMTDMGAITDSYVPETSDPINDNMHIIYAEDTTWHKMSHPAGEGRFFKTGTRTSPVTSFAREIAANENVPVGIVQSSVGGTNIYQWVSGVRDSDANSGYLIKALESCFDKMPSHNVKGILWYQGCNDAINENYAYDYKNLQKKVFDAMRTFFGENTPIITTQINDANQDSTDKLGYYDAWSFVKDVQRQNPDLYDNVYVIGTSDLELGDTIHNSASENLKVGARWANVAKNVVYGHTTVAYKQPTIASARVTGEKEITLTFKDTTGLKAATGTKRIGITNVSGGGVKITLGDLKEEFRVRSGGDKVITASNGGTGTNLTIASAQIKDNTKVVLTTSEQLSGRVAVDCMYGKRFAPTLVDADTDESVLSFFNVLADDPDGYITDTTADTEPTNIFGSAYNEIKAFNTSSLAETAIGTTGYKVSTTSSNYNNVAVRDKASTKDGYYPYGAGLSDNGFYLFFGSGGNGNVSATLTLPQKVSAGKYIKITYAKPKATNNGSSFRNEGNSDASISIGGEVIDLKTNCDWDTWYTSTVKLNSDVSKLDISLGKWSAMAISDIQILDSADTMELTAADNTTEMYITAENSTLQYTATVYSSITTLMGSSDVMARGTADTTANVTYSVNGYENVSINGTGLLTVTPEAAAGNVTVSAEYGSVKKSLTLELKAVGDADGVKIVGDEMVAKNGTLNLKAIPTVSGTVIPERATDWTIEGEALGYSISGGVLTAGSTAGNITVKATLKVEGKQTTANVSDTFTVTVKGDTVSPHTIKGVFLKNCAADLTTATGVDGIAVDTATVSTGYKAVVKATDANGIVIAQTSVSLDNAAAGVTEIKTPLTFANAAQVKAYIINSSNEVVSEEIYKTTETLYKNVPLVSDWITGTKSGLGMESANVVNPVGVPYGIDADTVDVSKLNVSYTYDNATYPEPTADNALWYKTGAYHAGQNSIYARDGVDWEQNALPIGNGYMGAMLFGLPDKDQIQLNEETFWAAGYRGVQSKTSSALDVNKKMSEGINGYMSVGNLFVDFNMPKNAQIKNYYRDLNLDDAVAHVQYEYDGTKYSREYFASYPKEVVAIRYTADKANALTFDVNPVSMHPGSVTVKDGEITIAGSLKDSEPYGAGGNAVWADTSDLEYCAKIKVIADGGTVTDGYNTVNVKNANAVTILVAAATDYDKDQFTLKADGTVDMTKTPYKSLTDGIEITRASRRISGAAAMTYDALKNEHIADYKSQFDKVKFSLTDNDEICKTPTDELQSSYKSVVNVKTDSEDDPKQTNADEKKHSVVNYDKAKYEALNKHLEELHFNYARYMMIASSRSNTMPATLQGKWCQSVAEIWGSCYCININLEMNYWFAGGANLDDSTKSLVYWLKSQIPAGTVTAKNYYGVTPKSYTLSGHTITFTDSTDDKDDVFIMHTKQAIMGTTDLTGSTNIQSAGNTAWLMYNLWDLYQTTGDKELLENDIYPIMRKLANFYTQYLYTNEKKTDSSYPDGYYYTTWKGRSPEHGPENTEGIKYDLQLVAGMYDYTIAAATTLGVDADKIAAWQEIRNHLETPIEIGEDGQIKEWKQEAKYGFDASGTQLGTLYHRHISHLVGLYPGTLINRTTPELIDGAKVVLQKRGDGSTGWSTSNKFLLWARALDGDKALEIFRYQLAQKTYSNLFDYHAPFQIDGNFGSAAGVMELLVQSQPLNQQQMNNQNAPIYILPALPSVWDKGEISGIKAKNGAEVSIKWEQGKATEIKIKPAVDGDITIGYDKGNIKSIDGAEAVFEDGMLTIANAEKGKTYTLSASEPTIERKITALTGDSVTAVGGSTDKLIIAGYSNRAMVKCEVADGLTKTLSGYDGCDTIKAFLWNGLSGMKPYDSKEITVTQ